jgi:hypothetical protein
LRKKIRDTLMNRIIYLAYRAVQLTLDNFLFILLLDVKRKISLANRTTEDVHE